VAVDGIGYSSSASATLTVVPLPQPPVVTLEAPSEVSVGETVVVNGTVEGYNVSCVEVYLPEKNIRTVIPLHSPLHLRLRG